MVMINPMTKQAKTISGSFLDFARWAPAFSPIIIMDISTPSVKKPIPTVKRVAPTRNSISGSRGMGVMVMHRINTIHVTGRTDDKDSTIFSFNF